jgi:hypothetical protein
VSDLPPPDTQPPPPPSPGSPTPSAALGPRGRRSRRTPLLVAVGTVAAAAVIVGGIAVGSGGGDDASTPADSSSEQPQETTSDTSAAPSTDPSSEPTGSPDTTPVDATTSTTGPRQVEADSSAAAAANVGVLAAQQSPECPVDAAVVETMANELGSQLARRGMDRLDGSTFFRQRTTGAAAIVCSAGTREEGVALYLGPLGETSLRAWSTQALINDAVRLRELDAQGDAAVFAVDSSTEVGNLSLAQKGAAWTDGTLVMMLLGVSIGGQRVDVDPGDAGRALAGSAEEIVTQLAGIELAEPPPAVPIDKPIDTSAAVTNLLAITEGGRSGEAMECPVSIGVLDAFNEPVGSTFLNRILDDTPIMGAGVDLYQRRGPTALRCTAGVENGLVGVYLGTLRGAVPGGWLSMVVSTLQYKQVGTDHQGTLLAVRERDPVTSIRGAAWTDGDLIVMIAAVGRPKALDFSPDQAAAGLRPALQAIVAELRAR